MPKKRTRNRKTIPLNTKSLGDDISAYPFVEIQWLDIEGDAGWSNTKDLKKEKLPVCVSKRLHVQKALLEYLLITF